MTWIALATSALLTLQPGAGDAADLERADLSATTVLTSDNVTPPATLTSDATQEVSARAMATAASGTGTFTGASLRRTHGTSGDRSIALPLNPAATGVSPIEPRWIDGLIGAHRVQFDFSEPVTSLSRAITVSRVGEIFPGTSFVLNGSSVAVTTGRVHNKQRYSVILSGLQAPHSFSVNTAFGWLIADADGSGLVDVSDKSLIGTYAGQAVGASNFLLDVTADGYLNAADVVLAQQREGDSISPFAALSEGSFEYPPVLGSPATPVGASWTFVGNAGLHSNGGPLTPLTAIDGHQMAFIGCTAATAGRIHKTVSFITDTVLKLQFSLRQVDPALAQTLIVRVNGVIVGSFAGNGQTAITEAVTLRAGDNTLELTAATCDGQARVALIDQLEWRETNRLDVSSLVLASTPNPLLPNQAFVLTAQVGPLGATGSVSFTEGTTVLCAAVPLVELKATCVVAADKATDGIHTFGASYSGDSNYAPASATLTTTPSAPLVCVLSAWPTPLYVGQQSFLTATCTSSGGVLPGATVTWTGCADKTLVTDADGQATCATPQLSAPGAVTLVARAAGYSDAAAAMTLTPVNLAACFLSASPATPAIDANTTITASCVTTGGAPLVGADLTWSGCATSGTVTDASGQATCNTAALSAPAAVTLAASKAGYATATAALTITPHNSMSCSLAAAPSSPAQGATVSVTVRCTDATGAPLDGVAISWANCTGATSTVAGQASCTSIAVQVPTTVSVLATLSGTAPVATSLTITPTIAPLSCVLDSDPAIPTVGANARITAHCTSNGAPVAGVNIAWTLFDGQVVGTQPSCVTPTDLVTQADGTAICTTSTLLTPTDASVQAHLAGYKSTTAQLTLVPGMPLACALTTTPSAPTQGAIATVTATCTTIGGAPVAAVNVVWSGCTASAAQTDANGAATCTTAALQAPLTVSVTGSRDDYSPATASLTINPQTTQALSCTLSATPTLVYVGNRTRVDLHCTAAGSPVAGIPVTWGLFIGGLGVGDALACSAPVDTVTNASGLASCWTPNLTAPIEAMAILDLGGTTWRIASSGRMRIAAATPTVVQQSLSMMISPVNQMICTFIADPVAPLTNETSTITATCIGLGKTALAGAQVTWTGCTPNVAITDANGQARCTTAPLQGDVAVSALATLSGYAPVSKRLTITQSAAPLICTLSANPAVPALGSFSVMTVACTESGTPVSGAYVRWNVQGDIIVISPSTGCVTPTETWTQGDGTAICTTVALPVPVEVIAEVFVDGVLRTRVSTAIVPDQSITVNGLTCKLTPPPFVLAGTTATLNARCATDGDVPVANLPLHWTGCDSASAQTDANGLATCTTPVMTTLPADVSLVVAEPIYRYVNVGATLSPDKPMTCTLSAQPATVVAGGAITVTATCSSGTFPVIGAVVGWTNCPATQLLTASGGQASCTIDSLSAPINISIRAGALGYAPATAILALTPGGASALQCTLRADPAAPAIGSATTVTALCVAADGRSVAGAPIAWTLFDGRNLACQSPTDSVLKADGTAICTTPGLTLRTQVSAAVTSAAVGAIAVGLTIDPASAAVRSLRCSISGPSVAAAGASIAIGLTCTDAANVPVAGVTVAWTSGVCSTVGTRAITDASGTAVCQTVPIDPSITTVQAAASATGIGSDLATTSWTVVAGSATGARILSITVPPNIAPGATVAIAIEGSGLSTGTLRTDAATAGTLACASSTQCTLQWTAPAPGIYRLGFIATDPVSNIATTTHATAQVQGASGADNVALATTTQLVGKLAGSLGVADSGAASYSIPIRVPPGVNGMQPALALTYSSMGGYGMLGQGWSLSGLGVISRCPKTVARDGYRGPVNYDGDDSNDAYCLNGQRLIPIASMALVGSDSNALKQEFRTEVDGYARIVGYREIPERPYFGFNRFTVETKSGQLMHYSRHYLPISNGWDACSIPEIQYLCPGAEVATQVKTFVLDEVSDAAGNTMYVDYLLNKLNGDGSYVLPLQATTRSALKRVLSVGAAGSYPPTEILPSGIRYGNNVVVSFGYELMPVAAQVRAFDSGAGESVTTQRLTSITTKVGAGGVIAKSYKLSYDDSSPTGRTHLRSIAECYDAGQNCLPATTFDWQGQTRAVALSYESFFNSAMVNYTSDSGLQMVGDVRGNGRSSVVLTDYNGDGSMRSLIKVCDVVSGVFTCQDQYVALGADVGPGTVGTVSNAKGRVYLADVNGDGKADLVGGPSDANGTYFVCLAKADGSGFGAQGNPSSCYAGKFGLIASDGAFSGDFFGNGRIQVLAYRGRDTQSSVLMHRFELLAWDDATKNFKVDSVHLFSLAPDELYRGSFDLVMPNDRFYVADFNGDGAADLLQYMPGVDGAGRDQWRVCYSRMDGAVKGKVHFDCPSDQAAVVAAGAGVLTPPIDASKIIPGKIIQCQIPQSALVSGSLTLKFSYVDPQSPDGYQFEKKTAALVENFVDQSGVPRECGSWSSLYYSTITTDDSGTMSPGSYSGTLPGSCGQGIGIALATSGDMASFPSKGIAQTVTLTRSSAEYNADPLVIGYHPMLDVHIASISNLPAGASCTQGLPMSVAGVTPSALGSDGIILADFNGDGLVDMAAPVNVDNVVDTGDWQVCLSTGDGSFARYVAPQTRASTCTTVHGMLFAPAKSVVAGDFDGDGRSDLMAYYNANGRGWQIAYARGASGKYASATAPVSFERRDLTSTRTPNGADAELARSARVGNFYGIGVSSLSMRASEHGAHGLYTPFDASGKAITQELVTRITDGLEAVTEIDYAPLTDPSVYGATPPLGFAAALATGEINVQAPMFVVKETRADNGLAECSGGGSGCNWHRMQYQYYGLRGTANGRGLLGFAQRDVTEVFGSTARTRVRTTYNNALAQWWQAGSPRQVIKQHLDASGTASVLTQTTFTYGAPIAHVVTPSSGDSTTTYYEVFPPATLTESWDLNGARLPTQSSVVDGYDFDGNPLKVTVTTDDGTEQVSKVSNNTYGFRSVTDATSSGPGRWVLGRLTGATVTHNRSGQAPVVRTSGFTYYGDGTNGCETSGLSAPVGYVCDEIIEPDAITGTDPTLWSSTRNEYDGTGNKIASTVNYMALAQSDGGGYVAASRSGGRTKYDASGTFPVTLTNALGHVEQRSYDARFGVATDVVGPNGLLTRSEVDNFGRAIRSRSFAGATSASATVTDAATQSGNCPAADPIYGQGCQGNEAYWRLSRSAGGAASISYYDRLEREVRVVSQAYLDSSAATNASANQWRSAGVAFDSHGRKAQVSKPAGDSTATTTYDYDDLDRVVKETLTGGSLNAVTVTVYNGQSTTVTRQRAASDPADRTDQSSTRTVDVQGKTKQITDALSGTTQYAYDAVGNLISVTAPGGLTEIMTYDLRGRKTTLASPQAGSYIYRYNGLSELQRQTDGRGWVTVNVYDALGRPQWREEREGATSSSPKIVTQWDYDGGTECGSRTIGKLCAVQTTKLNYSVGNGASTRSHTQYDNAGRAQSATHAVNLSDPVTAGNPASGPQVFATTTIYDRNSRVAMTGMASGEVFTNSYAAWGGGLWQVSGADGTVHLQANNRYVDGSAKSSAIGSRVSSRSVDGFGRTAGLSTDGNVQSGTYVFDSLGNLTNRSDPLNTLTAESYQYDALNRLTGRNGTPDTGYDALGNITVANSRAYAYSSGTQRLASVNGTGISNSYSYDNNGNVINDGSRTISYTAWNLPWQVSKGTASLAWDYDHAHSRVIERSRAHGATFYAPGYEKVVPIESTTANPRTIERTYIPTPDGVIGVITRSAIGNTGSAETVTSKTEYWHKDALGSIVAITDQSGNVVQRFRFDAWGNRVCLNAAGTAVACSADAVSGTEERGYTGHETLEEVGLVHMNGRLYDPAIGRMLQADPVIQNPSNGQNYNRYSYVLNSPLSLTDPSGYSWLDRFFARSTTAFHFTQGDLFGSALWKQHGTQAAESPYARMVGAAVAGYFTFGATSAYLGTGFWGTVGAGAASGAVAGGIQGQNVQSAARGAFSGAILAGANWYFSGNSSWLVRAAGNGVAGGVASSALGGSFRTGFLFAFGSSTLKSGLDAFVSSEMESDYRSTLDTASEPAVTKADYGTMREAYMDPYGEAANNNRAAGCNYLGNLCGVSRGVSQMGAASVGDPSQVGTTAAPGGWASESGAFMRTVNRLLPGGQALSIGHDAAMGRLQLLLENSSLYSALNPVTIPLYAFAQYQAFGLRSYIYYSGLLERK